MSLTDVLKNIVDKAAENPGQIFNVKLNRGLSIYVRSTASGTRVGMSRVGTFPSQLEISTVLKWWPGGPAVLVDQQQKTIQETYWIFGYVDKVLDDG